MTDEEYKDTVLILKSGFESMQKTFENWMEEEKRYRADSDEWRDDLCKNLAFINQFIAERKVMNGYGKEKDARDILRVADCKQHFKEIDECLLSQSRIFEGQQKTMDWHTKILWFIFAGIVATNLLTKWL
jgi:hypothetical protein